MSPRELVVLGTASQAPTRYRNHNGYLLRFDEHGILFDPGEGTQRQMALAGVSPTSITRICITHFHGDHCLGLPGIVQRLSLDAVDHPVEVCFPASGLPYAERLLHASIYNARSEVRLRPVEGDGVVAETDAYRLVARRLDHRVDAIGWRLEEPDGRTMVPERLREAGVEGRGIGWLQQVGHIEIGDRVVTLEEVSDVRPGQRIAFVMDTRRCQAAVELARDADLLVCEATFLSSEEELAWPYGHLTAAQAAQVALEAGARLLVLGHYSQRYPDEAGHLAEARAVFEATIAARDLDRIAVPPRRAHP